MKRSNDLGQERDWHEVLKDQRGHRSWSLSQTRQGYSTKLFFDIDYPNCNSSIFLCKWSDLQVFAAEILADGANFYAQSNTASNICLRPKAVNPKVASRWCACLMRSPGKHKTIGENTTAVTGAAVLSEGVSNGHIQKFLSLWSDTCWCLKVTDRTVSHFLK